MSEILFKEESFKIIGICMEIHTALGIGLKEINYKDAMEIEFQALNIPYEREKKFIVKYKGKMLKSPYIADFMVFNSFILEIKSVPVIIDAHIAQTLSYLNVSNTKLGIIINFDEKSLKWQRVIL
ncbi:MAG: GxxExxY protein [Chitinophaga sp.]|jgi:GxxExxY protein|nr:GxxExxY protein [Chitinophaga sp.]